MPYFSGSKLYLGPIQEYNHDYVEKEVIVNFLYQHLAFSAFFEANLSNHFLWGVEIEKGTLMQKNLTPYNHWLFSPTRFEFAVFQYVG